MTDKQEYKVGDKVRMVTERPEHWNPSGKMDKFLGAVLTVERFNGYSTSFKETDTDRWAFKASDIACLAESQQFLRGSTQAISGKQYLVLNDADRDFPKGTVVTAINCQSFSSKEFYCIYMNKEVLLQEITEEPSEELTFIQLIEKLPELAVGTEIEIIQKDKPFPDPMITVKDVWVSGGKVKKFVYQGGTGSIEIAMNEFVIFTRKYKIVTPKPEYTEITWQETLQIIQDGGEVFLDYEKFRVTEYTDFEDIDVEVGFEDFSDFFATTWYKKTE